MSPEIKVRLLGSMYSGRLVIVCGAGLSMAPPSELPAAWRVAEACYEEYRLNVDPGLDPILRHDLEALAEHFVGLKTLESVFIENLVPWGDFAKPPNEGHAAVADFLVTKAAAAALSANYDTLIERTATETGFDFRASLDGEEATVRADKHGPLLKFHGCANLDRKATVWARSQLATSPIAERIEKSKAWMAANLRQKDLLVVGFWTNWDYLNAVLGKVIDGLSPRSVTVFDPAGSEELQEKAPELWDLAHATEVIFSHVQESGAEALAELRQAFSTNYLSAMLAAGRHMFEQSSGVVCEPAWLEVGPLDNAQLYNLRRDAEGVPPGKAATRRRPLQCEVLGAFHIMLRQAGAVQTPEGYSLAGRSIRVVNGAGTALSTLKEKFPKVPMPDPNSFIVAPGAVQLPTPSNFMRSGKPGDILRPASAETWYDIDGAREVLGI